MLARWSWQIWVQSPALPLTNYVTLAVFHKISPLPQFFSYEMGTIMCVCYRFAVRLNWDDAHKVLVTVSGVSSKCGTLVIACTLHTVLQNTMKGAPDYFHVPLFKWSLKRSNSCSNTTHFLLSTIHTLIHLHFSLFSWNRFWDFPPSSPSFCVGLFRGGFLPITPAHNACRHSRNGWPPAIQLLPPLRVTYLSLGIALSSGRSGAVTTEWSSSPFVTW